MALLRYPGGKSKYTDFILPALYKLSGFSVYVEPFIGGATVPVPLDQLTQFPPTPAR